MMDKCRFPGCDQNADGLCNDHVADANFIEAEIRRQAVVVSALAHAMSAGFNSFDTMLKKETRRLCGMQSRRIQYLKLAGFDRVDEGVG